MLSNVFLKISIEDKWELVFCICGDCSGTVCQLLNALFVLCGLHRIRCHETDSDLSRWWDFLKKILHVAFCGAAACRALHLVRLQKPCTATAPPPPLLNDRAPMATCYLPNKENLFTEIQKIQHPEMGDSTWVHHIFANFDFFNVYIYIRSFCRVYPC